MKDVPENDSNFLQYKMLIHISKSFYGIQECKQSMFYKCKTCLGYLTKKHDLFLTLLVCGRVAPAPHVLFDFLLFDIFALQKV